MYLFFDTETTGLPKDYKQGPSDNDNWPRVIQMAWQVYNEKRELVSEYKSLIQPDGWHVDPMSEFHKEHGYSTEKCRAEGQDIVKVLSKFSIQLKKSTIISAHNMMFDYNVVGSEMMRLGISVKYDQGQPRPRRICTKEEGTDFCQIPNEHKWGGKYKWPTLSELHIKLFDKDFEGAHDAMDDVKGLASCFFGLVDAGVIQA